MPPLLCAGVTVFSPLRRARALRPGVKIGVVGLGGLGHLAVKIAKAAGCHVTVLSHSPDKQHSALYDLHADAFVLCTGDGTADHQKEEEEEEDRGRSVGESKGEGETDNITTGGTESCNI